MEEFTRIVGLTGGMGAGKSTLVEVIRKASIPVFDVDAEVHALYENPEIADHIGWLIGLPKPVTRQLVSQEIVKCPDLLPIVEEAMMRNLEQELRRRLLQPYDPFLVIDAPLLFEMGWDKRCDMIIAIQCPREIREARVIQRPNMTQEKMKLLMDKQVDETFRLMNSHFIIHNDKSIEEAKAKMAGIIEHLKDFYA
jgi:dephospho-CoA kinase